jgi:carboxymethylenebutenolidase
MTDADRAHAFGDAYLSRPPGGTGPGVLVLHSWWGLNAFVRDLCDRLADAGYVALAPDLLDGALPSTPDDAEAALAAVDMNDSVHLVRKAGTATQALSRGLDSPIAALGLSMGASWALWLSARAPAQVAAAVAFYGMQSVDFAGSRAAYLGHFAEYDALVAEDDVVELEAHLRLVGRPTTFHRYPGTTHGFFESMPALAYDESAAEAAWERTLSFLATNLA